MTDHKIWDPFVRAFHWSVAAGFLANALLIEDDSKLHEWVGYAILILVGSRILWGLIGPKSARFSSFWPTRTGVTEQLSDLATRRRKAHLGHTPLGALMIFNLAFVASGHWPDRLDDDHQYLLGRGMGGRGA